MPDFSPADLAEGGDLPKQSNFVLETSRTDFGSVEIEQGTTMNPQFLLDQGGVIAQTKREQ